MRQADPSGKRIQEAGTAGANASSRGWDGEGCSGVVTTLPCPASVLRLPACGSAE